ncbi:MAG TPA: HAMP domain-containing sensor histidine kinase [Thermoleophilaceae bacterium]|nr:HAMP domain-containing sensor histidine kinase [Thermoleophilaceae bacterium]
MSSRRPRPPLGRSLRDKLTLLFFGVTAAAFAVLYLLVVPELESNLRDQKFEELARVADGAQANFDRLTRDPDITSPQLDGRVERIANAIDARVTVLGIQKALGRGPDDFYTTSDSREEIPLPENKALAREAIEDGDLAFGEIRFRGEQLAQVAQPLILDGEPSRVVLYSRPLEDVTDTVAFVRSRMLIGGAIALLLALVGGAVVAQTLARRVRRLEIAAEDVAAGHYVEPLTDQSEDELGQLTRAFNAMQEQLRRVDVARREFVATASHELRTPIFSLGGFVELLRDEELDEAERRDFLDEIAQQVERLQKLAVDLLDLSRLDSGSLALDIDTVDLAEVASMVAGEFKPATSEHDTDLQLELPAGGVAARCDRERVVQILRILLDNALRHTPPGTTVRVGAGSDSAGAAITIADSGPGLPDGKPVFDRFVTGGESQGAGLGLAIARELAERMGGSLRASANGDGAAFTLELPEAPR